ncbi:MAG TPA: ribonuclease E inhibitor RraB [Steroidobacteraceae bacterium]|nr:ribonuclease E inhibitor RraB [Steroidobacteraceae bacterium]
MLWFIVVLSAAAVLIVTRIYVKVRNIQRAEAESWDAKVIERLRSQGYAPFNEYRVDFFLALPDEAACRAVRSRLEPEGFSVDVKPMDNDGELPLSLHASRSMRLIVPDMQELSRRMTVLAQEHRGRYDGWAA